LPDQPQRRAVLRIVADPELVADVSVVAGHIQTVFEALKAAALAAA